MTTDNTKTYINGRYADITETGIAMLVEDSSMVEYVAYYFTPFPRGDNFVVRFKGGAFYYYYGVSHKDALTVLTAESIGKAVNANIKGKYEYEKI